MNSNRIIPALVAVLVLSWPAWAQQAQPQLQPQSGGTATPIGPISTQANTGNAQGAVPAARGLFVSYNEDSNGATQVDQDDHFLSGVETFSLGVLRSFTTMFDPSVFATESANNALIPGQWDTSTSVGGGLGLVRDWNHARITAQYYGAESFNRPGTQYNASYHDLSLAQSFHSARWGLVIRDDMMYTRGSSLGGFQTGGIAPSTGTGSVSPLQPGVAPAETIVTGQVDTLNNTAAGQGSYQLSRRAAVTLSAAFGILHFREPGYIDSHTESGALGYNYLLSPFNSVAATYTFSQDNFDGSTARATTQTFQGAFGRKITGRLAMQAAAGPQLATSRNSFGTQSGSQFAWAASASLTYGPRPRNVSYTVSYSHGLTSGSGVFYGAETDSLTGSVQAHAGRSWSGSINGGYASNRSLAGAAGLSATRYDNWFSGVSMNRAIGRQIYFTLTYQYLHQFSNGSCPVLSCGVTPSEHSVSARLEWHPFPARIE